MNCGWIAFAIIFSTLCVIDYVQYRNGGKALLFEDKTEIEKLNREIEIIKARNRLEKLKYNNGGYQPINCGGKPGKAPGNE